MFVMHCGSVTTCCSSRGWFTGRSPGTSKGLLGAKGSLQIHWESWLQRCVSGACVTSTPLLLFRLCHCQAAGQASSSPRHGSDPTPMEANWNLSVQLKGSWVSLMSIHWLPFRAAWSLPLCQGRQKPKIKTEAMPAIFIPSCSRKSSYMSREGKHQIKIVRAIWLGLKHCQKLPLASVGQGCLHER